jgi:hypothetical protein
MLLASFSHQSIHFSDDAMMAEDAAKYFEGTIPIEFHDSTKCDACDKSPLWGAVYSCIQCSTADATPLIFARVACVQTVPHLSNHVFVRLLSIKVVNLMRLPFATSLSIAECMMDPCIKRRICLP